MPPPGDGLRILIEYWPDVPGIEMLSCVDEATVAAIELPFIKTSEPFTNPEPVMVNVSPATVVTGEAVVIAGTGSWILKRYSELRFVGE
jgi:hypothetical protein